MICHYVIPLESSDNPAYIVAYIFITGLCFAGKKSAGQGGKGHKANAQFLTGGNDFRFKAALHHGKLALYSCELRDRMGAA
ncbi:hypothetical protein FACS1894167_04860 [Synergistales bacterium]|nr:hypothetical protein FACS1894167_04860 [Synergistales bacterium]